MRVLSYVPKIYEPQLSGYSNDKSGLAIYVHEILISLEPRAEVYVLTQQVANGGIVNGINYISNKTMEVIINATPVEYFHAIYWFIKSNGKVKSKLKRAFLALEVGRFRHALYKTKPDIVNIHGCNPEIFSQIEVCQKAKIPFVISLHGLIGLDSTVNTTEELRMIEKKILKCADEHQWPIVAISSGVKTRAVEFYDLKHSDNIHVILNGTKPVSDVAFDQNVFKQWFSHINPKEKKIILCVGAISKRKNQSLLVEAWNQLPKGIQDTHMVLFLGKDLLDGEVQNRIKKYHLQDSMYVCGHIEKDILVQLYKMASLNVLASVDEGFGLSLVESMCYGVPSVTFSDLDAVKDLYNSEVMMLSLDRTAYALASTINVALNREWNKEYIIKESQKYSMKNVAEEYINLYTKWVQAK